MNERRARLFLRDMPEKRLPCLHWLSLSGHHRKMINEIFMKNKNESVKCEE